MTSGIAQEDGPAISTHNYIFLSEFVSTAAIETFDLEKLPNTTAIRYSENVGGFDSLCQHLDKLRGEIDHDSVAWLFVDAFPSTSTVFKRFQKSHLIYEGLANETKMRSVWYPILNRATLRTRGWRWGWTRKIRRIYLPEDCKVSRFLRKKTRRLSHDLFFRPHKAANIELPDFNIDQTSRILLLQPFHLEYRVSREEVIKAYRLLAIATSATHIKEHPRGDIKANEISTTAVAMPGNIALELTGIEGPEHTYPTIISVNSTARNVVPPSHRIDVSHHRFLQCCRSPAYIDDSNIAGKGSTQVLQYIMSELANAGFTIKRSSRIFRGKSAHFPAFFKKIAVAVMWSRRPVFIAGDFPLPFKRNQVLYIQQALLFSPEQTLKWKLRRLYFFMFIGSARNLLVQTNWMKQELSRHSRLTKSTIFVDKGIVDWIWAEREKHKIAMNVCKASPLSNYLVCITSNYPHKRNDDLVKFWRQEGFGKTKRRLAITLSGESDEAVCFLGSVENRKILNLLANSDGLISNSTCESLFIPALEAIHERRPMYLRNTPVIKEMYTGWATIFDNLSDVVEAMCLAPTVRTEQRCPDFSAEPQRSQIQRALGALFFNVQPCRAEN